MSAPLLPEPIDWAARWRAIMDARRSQRAPRERVPAGGDHWARRADRLASYSERLPDDDPLLGRLRATIRPTDTIIDVGAGAGRYALPLAYLARQVIAVEPSPALRERLAARLSAESVTNVEIVPTDWEAADVAPAEVVLCSHVVYAVEEIVPFVHKLDDLTRRTCLVALRIGQQPGAAALWAALYGVPRAPQPAFLDLYNVLASIGIVGEVQIIPSGGFRYADLDEATAEVRERMHLPPDNSTDDALRARLREQLVRDASGWLTWPEPVQGNAIISWTRA
ncbi:MAG: methyltransferase domain-containing protein [Chloroflexi bacterium]|nr:methyltransferase domain-containing protein [Chloroflexota bacterium]